MVKKRDINTEEKIIQAAKKVFVKQGMAGARMQQIADEAGINKALLHYYFRSKEKLFKMIFHDAMKDFLPRIVQIFSSEAHLFDKIRQFVEEYLNMVEENPYLPMFILHEAHCNSSEYVYMSEEMQKKIVPLVESINKAIADGSILPIKPVHLFVNMISLCAFPFISKPLVIGNFLQGEEEQFTGFVQERKEQVAEFIIRSIKK